MSPFALDFEFTPRTSCSIEAWAVAIGAGVAAVGSIASGAIEAGGAESAAQTQAAAEEQAASIQEQEQQNIIGLEQPFVGAGEGALGQLQYLLGEGTPGQNGEPVQMGSAGTGGVSGGYGSLLTPFTAANMAQYSPAYQFQLQQGQAGLLNSTAGQGGPISGAALQSLSQFNQNYANTAYNSAFNQYQTQTSNTYNRLANLANLGQSAASQTAQSGTTLAGNIGSAVAGAGAASAAGTVGAANAIGGSLSNIGSLGLLYSLQNQNPSSAGSFNTSYTLGQDQLNTNLDELNADAGILGGS